MRDANSFMNDLEISRLEHSDATIVASAQLSEIPNAPLPDRSPREVPLSEPDRLGWVTLEASRMVGVPRNDNLVHRFGKEDIRRSAAAGTANSWSSATPSAAVVPALMMRLLLLVVSRWSVPSCSILSVAAVVVLPRTCPSIRRSVLVIPILIVISIL